METMRLASETQESLRTSYVYGIMMMHKQSKDCVHPIFSEDEVARSRKIETLKGSLHRVLAPLMGGGDGMRRVRKDAY